MVNIQFQLKDPKADFKTSIRCLFYYQGKRFLYSLGDDKTIFPKLWDERTMRPITAKTKGTKDIKDIIKQISINNYNLEHELSNINQRIENVNSEIQSFINNKEFQKQAFTFDELRDHLKSIFSSKQKSIEDAVGKSISLNEFIEQFVLDIASGKRTYTSRGGERNEYAPSSVKVYREFKTQFDLFQKVTKSKLNFDDIDLSFYEKYVAYYSNKGYKTNAIGKQVKCLKTILTIGLDEDIHSNKAFQKKEFKTLKAEVDSIYLTNEELKLIQEIDLSEKPHFDQARDIFLCGCYTALRFSDYSRLKAEYIVKRDGQYYIDMITQKTKQRVIIPVKPLVIDILNKYNNQLPKSHEQKVNRYIKQIGEMCGIDSEVEVMTNVGSKVKISFIPKYKLIMTHTARRTGATLLYSHGVKPYDIMKITGHKTEKTLLNYIKINSEENAFKLKDNPFFS